MNTKEIFNTIAALWCYGFSAQWPVIKKVYPAQQW